MTDESYSQSHSRNTGGSWNAGDGWQQLYPGRSTIADMQLMFGPADGEERLSNAAAFDYWDGMLRFVFLDNNDRSAQPVLSSIHISSHAAQQAGLPASFAEAKALFGNLQPQDFDKRLSTCIYETEGIRLACDESQVEPRIKWFEFFAV